MGETKQVMEMGAFFDMRAEQYDVVHTAMIGGGIESKDLMASFLDENTKKLVDFGCGTGLELKEIFKRFPEINVTGIDLSKGMLEKLKEKYPAQQMTLIQGDYMIYEFGENQFDGAISVMTMHHFNHEAKLMLYKKLYKALTVSGRYVECDYVVDTQEEEKFFFSEYEKIKLNQGITEGYYHYDTPCTVSNQKKLLKRAGFSRVEEVWHKEQNVILIAYK